MTAPSSATGTAAGETGCSTGQSRPPGAQRQRGGPAGSAPRTRRGGRPACPSPRPSHYPAAAAAVPCGSACRSPPAPEMPDGAPERTLHKYGGLAWIASLWLISSAPLRRSVQGHGEGAAAHRWPPRIPAVAATDSGDGATDSGLGGWIRASDRLDRSSRRSARRRRASASGIAWGSSPMGVARVDC
jgi:hypothetical protein